MTAIQDLKTGPSSCEFSLMYCTGLDFKTVPFIMKKKWNICHFSCFFDCIQDGYSDHLFETHFTLEFEKEIAFDKNQIFELIVYLNDYTEYEFTLKKISDNKFQSQSGKSSYIYSTEIYNGEYYTFQFKINWPKKSDLLKNMKSIFKNETHSDVKLVADDKIFNVHKSIISGRNEVLAKMIEDMVKKGLDTINLPGWDPTVVEELLNFIYTEKCDITKTPHDLFKLSHFLQIEKLQILCKDYIISNIKNENLTKALELSKNDQYDLGDLDNAAKKFIKNNESALAKELDFIDCLSNSININNTVYVLQFSDNYNVESLKSAAMKYVFTNYSQVVRNVECKKYLKSNPDLLFDMFEYLLDKPNSTSDAKTE